MKCPECGGIMISVKDERRFDGLMKIAIKEQYKELCDKIKLQILTKLEEYAIMKSEDRDKRFITFNELAHMRMELNKVRSKEHEQDMKVIGGVISSILDRDKEIVNGPNSLHNKEE